jgi:hypothetical protein
MTTQISGIFLLLVLGLIYNNKGQLVACLLGKIVAWYIGVCLIAHLLSYIPLYTRFHVMTRLTPTALSYQ